MWFQNKRQRTKNGAKPTVAEALAHAVYSAEHRTQKEPAELLMNMAAGGAADDRAPEADAPHDGRLQEAEDDVRRQEAADEARVVQTEVPRDEGRDRRRGEADPIAQEREHR